MCFGAKYMKIDDWWQLFRSFEMTFNFQEKNRHFYDFCSFYSSCWFFKDISVSTHTRGHKYKLYKHQSSVNAHKYFFSNISDIWNALPSFVVEASSLDCFKRLLNQVDLLQFTVLLLWLCACIFCFWAYVSGYLPFMSSNLFIKYTTTTTTTTTTTRGHKRAAHILNCLTKCFEMYKDRAMNFHALVSEL